MLVFSFLFATIFLQSVDYLERYIPSRTFSVILIIGSFLISSLWFIGSFISNLGEQIQIFTNKIQQENFITDLMSLSVKLRDKLPNFLDNSFPESDQIITFAQNSLGNLFQNIGKAFKKHGAKEITKRLATRMGAKKAAMVVAKMTGAGIVSGLTGPAAPASMAMLSKILMGSEIAYLAYAMSQLAYED